MPKDAFPKVTEFPLVRVSPHFLRSVWINAAASSYRRDRPTWPIEVPTGHEVGARFLLRLMRGRGQGGHQGSGVRSQGRGAPRGRDEEGHQAVGSWRVTESASTKQFKSSSTRAKFHER